MKRGISIRVVVAIIVAMAPVFAAYLALHVSGNVLFLFLYPAATILFASIAVAVEQRLIRRVFAVSSFIAHSIGAASIIISLNLTPSSAYLAWFRLIQHNEASGVLSYMFAFKIAFFSTVCGHAILRRNAPASIAAAIAFAALVLYAVFQENRIIYLSIAMGILALIIIALGSLSKPAYRRGATAIVIVLISGLLAWPMARIEAKSYNPLISTSNSNRLASLIMWIYPEFPYLYNMPGYGHQLGEKNIGDRPTLTERPVFEVTGIPGETVYLRTAAYESFTGTSWHQGSESSGGRLPFSGADPEGYERPLRVEVLIDFFSSVPHTIDTMSLNLYKGDFPPLRNQSLDTGFLFEIPVVSGTVFYLDRGPKITSGVTAGGRPRDSFLPGDSPGSSPSNLGDYLQLPKEIPEGILDLAGRLKGADPYRTAERIKQYLAAEFYYSLEPTDRRSDTPVWDFLTEARAGYCVHFATAFALLARMNGIPARYVTGFLVNIPRDSDRALVPGYASHAWIEMWTNESGWVIQEATPPMLGDFLDDPFYYDIYNPLDSNYTGRQLEIIMGDRIPSRSRVATERRRLEVLLPLGVSLIAASIIGVLVWFFLRSSRAPLTKRRKMKIAIERMIVKSIRIGAEDPATAGWSLWGRSIDQNGNLGAGDAVEMIHRVYFGGEPIPSEALHTIRTITKTLRQESKRQ